MIAKSVKIFLFCLTFFGMPLSAYAEWESRDYGKDAFNDQNRTLAASRNTDGQRIVVKCDEYMSNVYIDFILGKNIASKEYKDARIRFDKKPIIKLQGYADKDWIIFSMVSTDRYVRTILDGLRTSQTVAIEVHSDDNGRIVASIPVAGFQKVEPAIRATCKFPD